MTTKEDKIIIFATRQSLLFLQNDEDWFMDGAFSTVPPKFLQLYTIHGIHHVRNVVGTYCLLRNKRRETYTEKISQLKHLTNNAIHHSIIIDFCHGIIVTLNQEYPLVQQKVCLFIFPKPYTGMLCMFIFPKACSTTSALNGRFWIFEGVQNFSQFFKCLHEN